MVVLGDSQIILTQLIQALFPLEEAEEPSEGALLPKQLFVPTPVNRPEFPHTVQLLRTLRQAKSLVDASLEANPEGRPEEGRGEPPNNGIREPAPKGPRTTTEKGTPEPASLRGAAGKGEGVPVQKQAMELIASVRGAILALHPNALQLASHTRTVSFRDVLAKLKPMIDSFIEAVGESDHSAMGDSQREPKIPKTHTLNHPTQMTKKEIPLPFRSNNQPDADVSFTAAPAHEHSHQRGEMTMRGALAQEAAAPKAFSSEKTTIAAAPFTPHTFSYPVSRKRKRRQYSWIYDGENKEEKEETLA